MQTAQSEIHSGTANPSQFAQSAGGTAVAPGTASGVNLADYKIIRRNGAVVSFEPSKIAVAMTKAFLAVNGGQGAASARVRELVDQQTQNVVRALLRSRPNGGTFHIEDVQDQVTGPDALGRARRGPRLRAVPRAPRPGARASR